MDKLGAPRGLARFGAMQPGGTGATGSTGGTGATGIAGGTGATGIAVAEDWRAALRRPRLMVYASALLLLAAAMAWGWAQRPELRLNALRDRGVLARPVEDGAVENVYRLQVMNASLQPRNLRLQALTNDGSDARPLPVDHRGALAIDAAGALSMVVTVRMDAAELQRHRRGAPIPIRLVVDDVATGTKVQAQSATTFLPG